MGRDRMEQGAPVLKDTLNFAKGVLGRDLSWGEMKGFIDLTEEYGSAEVNEKLRDVIGGIREERNVTEFLDRLRAKRGLGLVDIIGLDLSYCAGNPLLDLTYDDYIDWSGQIDDADDLWNLA